MRRPLLLLSLLAALGYWTAAFPPFAMKQSAPSADGRRLEFMRAGTGNPAVVFLSGYGVGMELSWRTIFPEVAAFSTALAYNRFNYGNSDAVRPPQTGRDVVAALRVLLAAQGLKPPYVLVAHSLGGLYAQLFARLHPDEVAGVVLIDASHPDQETSRRAQRGAWHRAVTGAMFGIDGFLHPWRHGEFTTFDETARQIAAAPAFPAIPLTVISAGKSAPAWLVSEEFARAFRAQQRQLVSLSPRGQQILAARSGHFVQRDEPELVIRAIRAMIETTRTPP